MTPDEQFMATICKYPAEDGPRLVYADFLAEQGDDASLARCDFIRVQCELSRILAAPTSSRNVEPIQWCGSEHMCRWINGYPGDVEPTCRFHALRRRESSLLELHGAKWIPQIGDGTFHHAVTSPSTLSVHWLALPQGHAFQFVRGFVEQITASFADFVAAHKAGIREATPLRRVSLTSRPVLFRNDHDDKYCCQLWQFHQNGKVHRIPDYEWQSVLRDEIPEYERRKFAELLAAEFHDDRWPDLEFVLPAEQRYRDEGGWQAGELRYEGSEPIGDNVSHAFTVMLRHAQRHTPPVPDAAPNK